MVFPSSISFTAASTCHFSTLLDGLAQFILAQETTAPIEEEAAKYVHEDEDAARTVATASITSSRIGEVTALSFVITFVRRYCKIRSTGASTFTTRNFSFSPRFKAVLDTKVIYPTAPQNKVTEAKAELKRLIRKYNVSLISVGNGTASRESEQVIVELLKERDGSGASLSHVKIGEFFCGQLARRVHRRARLVDDHILYRRIKFFQQLHDHLLGFSGGRTVTDRDSVFGKNLEQLLLQPPIAGKVVLGWDPAFRTGCNVLVLAHTDGFRIDLHKLRQRILQSSGDGSGASLSHVKIGEFFCGQLAPAAAAHRRQGGSWLGSGFPYRL